METPKGIEALKNCPFKDIALRQDVALAALTRRARDVFRANVDYLLQTPDLDPNAKENLQSAHSNSDRLIPPGGVSLDEDEMNSVYGEWGKLTFVQVTGKFMTEVFPQFLNKEEGSRGSGVVCLGYILDLLATVDPKVASFDEGVQAVIIAIREGANSDRLSWLFGAMVDDTLHCRRTLKMKLPLDLLADRDGAARFQESFLRLANPHERDLFQKGVDITLREVYENGYGISLN